jgi:hypothetical protein
MRLTYDESFGSGPAITTAHAHVNPLAQGFPTAFTRICRLAIRLVAYALLQEY